MMAQKTHLLNIVGDGEEEVDPGFHLWLDRRVGELTQPLLVGGSKRDHVAKKNYKAPWSFLQVNPVVYTHPHQNHHGRVWQFLQNVHTELRVSLTQAVWKLLLI